MKLANPPASEGQIRAVEAQIGTALPPDYRAFLLQASGGRFTANQLRWSSGANAETTLNDMASVTPGQVPNVLEDYEMLRDMDRIPTASLPVGDDPAGNAFLLSLEPGSFGAIFFWDHEREPADGGAAFADFPNVEQVAPSFEAFVNALLPG